MAGIVWRNALNPGPERAGAPPVAVTIARTEELDGATHIWYVPVPARPGPAAGPGSIVHYDDGAAHCRAAIITAAAHAAMDSVDLTVFTPGVTGSSRGVLDTRQGDAPGTWHWPEAG
jgi:hypothetical protein